jgi:hypothetical protein
MRQVLARPTLHHRFIIAGDSCFMLYLDSERESHAIALALHQV